ncbi:MAG TPA: T9SS type A sorting domain-containing protein [Puia sp.]|nr:T9SS type A sorting domain-containing protein [Puia sp.]
MKTVPKSLCSIIVAILFMMANPPTFAASKPILSEKNNTRYFVVVNKTQNSKKHKVRLYTDAGRQNILFTVNGVEGKKYQLYIFDMDSRLVTQVNTYNGETSALNNISKGSYLFQVLIDDEQIESGKLTIK